MRYLTLFVLALFIGACVHVPDTSDSADVAAIKTVVTSLQRSLANRDRDGYLSSFLTSNAGRQSVLDDFQLARERRKNPQATRAQVDPSNTHLAFIENVLRNPKIGGAADPPVFPISVETDGDVASASQEYRYFYDGRELHRGRIFWLLVKTEAGWKITASAYSKKQPGKP